MTWKWRHLTFFGDGRACLDGPGSVLDLHKLEVAHDLLSVEGKLQVLLVGEHEQRDILEVVLDKEGLKFLGALLQALLIGGVNDVNETIGVLEIILPVGANGALTTDIPNVQLEAILSLNAFQTS